MPRLIIASVSTTFRAGIHALLGGDPDFRFLGEVKGPDDSPGADCDDCIWIFSSSDAKWLLSAFQTRILYGRGFLIIGDEEVIHEIIMLGNSDRCAWGVLPVHASNEALRYALHAIDQGLTVMSPAAAVREIRGMSEPDAKKGTVFGNYEPLTERELEVLNLLGEGLANKQIAHKLQLSENTIKFHISSIYSKLDVGNRTEALRKGAYLGLVAL